jgi:hexosaminidase
MKSLITGIAMAVSVILPAGSADAQVSLMPTPARMQSGAGRLPIDSGFAVAFEGTRDARLEQAVTRALRRIEGRTGLTFTRHGPSGPSAAPGMWHGPSGPSAAPGGSASTPTLVIRAERPGATLPSLDEDESYRLEITPAQARLIAPTTIGAMRGLETLQQLVSSDRAGAYLPAVSIDDRPRFPWRGLLIDVCRHWMPMDVLKRNLDAMTAVKLNVLHLHLTEDQGFRIESRRYPKLHQMGSDGLYYTQDQMREVIAYARDRGIRVVPEFDMPGHVTSWLVGHPELASAPGPYSIERRWGIFDPAFDPTREELYTFLDNFLGEMAKLFPDAYLHIGGDENNGKHWAANPNIQKFMTARGLPDAHALQAYFNQRLLKILQKHGKRMIGWDEILHPTLPKDIVVQSWRGQKSLAEGARQGYSGILSAGYYLDLMRPTSSHYIVDPLPADVGLSPEEAARVLGGEACMWAEFVSPETIDSRIWPRLAAIAERLWSPREVNDVADMYRRLERVSVRLEELGLLHESHEGRLLRRIAGDDDVEPLRMLIAVVEPVKEYRRGQLRPASQMMPLTRLADAARADSGTARRVRTLVDELVKRRASLSGSPASPELEAIFRSWRDLRPAIDRVMDRSMTAAEGAPLADDLVALGTIGLEALSYLSSGVTTPEGWAASARSRIDQAAIPKAEVEIAVIQPVRALLDAAAAAR